MDAQKLAQKAETDRCYAIALGLFAVAKAIDRLGTGKEMGAIEFLSVRLTEEIKHSSEGLTDKLDDLIRAVNSLPPIE